MKKMMMAAMVAALVCVAVVLGIYPADRTVWCVEMVWAVGLWAILLLTRRKFRFSTPAYLCFFVWTVLQLVGAHYTFEHVPMEWLMKPLGLVRNPYDRIARDQRPCRKWHPPPRRPGPLDALCAGVKSVANNQIQ